MLTRHVARAAQRHATAGMAASRSVSRAVHTALPAAAAAAAAAPPVATAASAPPSRVLTPADIPTLADLGISALARPGGRGSVSGIVCTVFGCSGFLGRYVVGTLGGVGSQVITPYRSLDGMNVRHLKLAGDLGQVVPIPCDIGDVDSVRRCVQKSNVVINLIGSNVETVHYLYDDVHAKIPYRLAQVAKAAGVERFVQVSALGADPGSPSGFYRSKAAGEAAVREFYPDATIIRPSKMFGAGDRFLGYYAYVGKKLAALPMTRNGERRIQPVFVDDVARAILHALGDPESRGRTYELVGDQSWSEAELIELTRKHTGIDIRTCNMSDSTALLFASLLSPKMAHYTNPPPDASIIRKVWHTLKALKGKLGLPGIFHADMVHQRHVDLEPSGQFGGLRELGVMQPARLQDEIDRLLQAHQMEEMERFPDATRMHRDAETRVTL